MKYLSCSVVVVGVPFAFEVDTTRILAFVLDGKPLIEATMDRERGYLGFTAANEIIIANIIIEDGILKLVSLVFDIDSEVLALPMWVFSATAVDAALPVLITVDHLAVGVHLTERFSVSGQMCLQQMYLQSSQRHSLNY